MKINQNNFNNIDTINLLKNKIKNSIENDKSLANNNFAQKETLLKELFKNLNHQIDSKSKILALLKNLPIFKDFDGFTKEIKKLIYIIEKNPHKNENNLNQLKATIINIGTLDKEILKSNVKASGIFLENYVKKFMQDKLTQPEIINNIKTTILQLSHSNIDDIKNQANRIISQFEYFSLFSLVNNSNKIPLQIEWDDFNDGDIEFHESQKNLHTCQINLDLETLGKIKINLSYDENEHINIAFLCDDKYAKGILNDNMQDLRKQFNQSDLKIQSIGTHDLKVKNSLDKKFLEKIHHDYGIDIKA